MRREAQEPNLKDLPSSKQDTTCVKPKGAQLPIMRYATRDQPYQQRPPGPNPQRSDFLVKTNFFETSFNGNSATDSWYMHKITIEMKKRKKWADRDKPLSDIEKAHSTKANRLQEKIAAKGSNEHSREVLIELSKKVSSETGIQLVTDLAQTGISPTQLWNYKEDNVKVFHVEVDARVYLATLEFTVSIPLGSWSMKPRDSSELDVTRRICQCLDILFKCAMTENLIAVGTNPKSFYFKETIQKELISGRHAFSRYYYSNPGSLAPFIGISQSARFSNAGKFLLAINNKVDWLYRSSLTSGTHDDHADVPLLNVSKSTLAHVKVNLHEPVSNPRLQQEIENALSNLTFRVKYVKGQTWEQDVLARDKGHEYIQKYKHVSIPNQRLFARPTPRNQDQDAETANTPSPKLKWSCYDETFQKRKGETVVQYNVASYFEEIYGIRIRYPNLPVVSCSRGFFPVEFLFHETTRSGGNDSEELKSEKINRVLAYHDDHAGRRRVDHICTVLGVAARIGEEHSFQTLLEKFNLSLNLNPLTIPARRLKPPALLFGNGRLEERVDNGSWNLANKKFAKGAELSTLAVVDFGRKDGFKVEAFLDCLFHSMEQHGMKIYNGIQNGPVIERANGVSRPYDVRRRLRTAHEMARRHFLARAFFYGIVLNQYDASTECSWIGLYQGIHHRIPNDKSVQTHEIWNMATGASVNARIKFKVGNHWKDPSEVAGDCQDVIGNNHTIGFKAENWEPIIQTDEISKIEPLESVRVEEWQIEACGFLVCFLPQHDTKLYNCVKTFCDLELGCNSQCVVQLKVGQQRRLEQYCSNVALKQNTKLYSKHNQSCGWKLSEPMPWLEASSTMIFGYSFSHGRHNGRAITAVAGSVCLRGQLQMAQSVRFQSSDMDQSCVNPSIMKSLFRELAKNFYEHVQEIPTRFVVFRDGGSEGSFDSIIGEEASAIREAIDDLNGSKQNTSKITFMIANKDHNACIVPQQNIGRNCNVPCGTLVDNVVQSFHMDNVKYDFFLIPQGGLKGTSKSVHYFCILNDNPEIGQDRMKDLIFRMSFQYGTATKSTRMNPVLLNSEKLANRAISYGAYLNLAGIDLGLSDGSESELVKLSPDGRPTNLLTGYSPFAENFKGEEHWKLRFRPHLTA